MSGKSIKWSSWSPELPPKVDYSRYTGVERDLHIQFGMWAIKDEFQLYKRAENAAHMWRCYQLWRRLMPDDLPLPRELLAYLDRCAKAVMTKSDPQALKSALGLVIAPGKKGGIVIEKAKHGGGRTGDTAAAPVRRQRNAVMYVREQLFAAARKGAKRGHKDPIYRAAAEKFGVHVSTIKRWAKDWQVAEAVERDLRQWRGRKK